MKNTLENKAKFFAQYWGQKVVEDNKWFLGQLSYVGHNYKVTAQAESKIGGLYSKHLLLKPISSISDEDAEAISKIGLPDRLYYYLWGALTGKQIVQSIDGGRQTNTYYPHFRFVDVFDYLRSKGYALPWMGVSVEEQVKRGWVVLKTD